jgi:hypothetical protein
MAIERRELFLFVRHPCIAATEIDRYVHTREPCRRLPTRWGCAARHQPEIKRNYFFFQASFFGLENYSAVKVSSTSRQIGNDYSNHLPQGTLEDWGYRYDDKLKPWRMDFQSQQASQA